MNTFWIGMHTWGTTVLRHCLFVCLNCTVPPGGTSMAIPAGGGGGVSSIVSTCRQFEKALYFNIFIISLD